MANILFAPSPPTTPEIVLVVVTEDTLATLPYRSPVNRDLLANVIEKARRAGAKAVAFDVLLDRPTEQAADARLASALVEFARDRPLAVAYATRREGLTEAQSDFLDSFTRGLPRGLVNLPQDGADAVVRWFLTGLSVGGENPSLGLASVIAHRLTAHRPDTAYEIKPLAYTRTAPGVIADFISYPAHVVVHLPDEWLAGKIVLVGADLPSIDRFRTPFSGHGSSEEDSIPGVAIHAHALNQLLNDLSLKTLPRWALIAAAFALALGVTAIFRLDWRIGVRMSLAATALVAFAIGAVLALRYGQTQISILPPLLSGLTAAALGGGREWRRERHKRAFIENAFSHYLSPSLVKLLSEHPERLRLGGEKRDITYVFTDLAGFTAFTERNSPELLVETLNTYLDKMCAIALDHGATIDKIVGDAVVTFFGAPIDQPDHAVRGVRLALAYDEFSEAFRTDMRRRGFEIGVTRVGVHSGPAIVGNFGGNRFFNYTGHGDTVNTAARLESVNKHLGTRLCVSAATAAQCPGVSFRPVGTLTLVGKEQGIDCFEPLSSTNGLYAPEEDYRSAFGLLSNEPSQAAQAFRRLAGEYPHDPLVALHYGRLSVGQAGVAIKLSEK